MEKKVTKKKVAKKVAKKATKKVVKKTAKKVAKKAAPKKVAHPVENLLAGMEKKMKEDAAKRAKENAPADKLLKKLEAFCKKNKIRIFGTMDLYGLERVTTRCINVDTYVQSEGLKRITEEEL